MSVVDITSLTAHSFIIEPPGSRLPLHLASVTRAPTLQHISDRINLISAQHNLGAPSRMVSSLMMLAFEVCLSESPRSGSCNFDVPIQAKLKQMITHVLSLTSSSHAITSIQPVSKPSTTYPLSASSFDTLFTISPSILPNKSAAAMRLAFGENEMEDEYVVKDSEVKDHKHQMLALLGERSTVKEALKTLT